MTGGRGLKLATAAELAGVSVKTLRRAIKLPADDPHHLPAYKPGGQRDLVVLEEDLDRWRRVPFTPKPRRAAPAARRPSRAPAQRGGRDALRAIEEKAS